MPIHLGIDSEGTYFQWGTRGKKYYFKSERTKKEAYRRAARQARAIYSTGWRE